MYTTKVNVNDLVIDMPLDEANVARMAKIMDADGQTIPIIIWLKDFRVIDGFHRVAAAKRLGWQEIFCNVEDCSEEDFWDRRVVFSRPHHTLTDERLAIWISECWNATDWCQEGIIPEVKEAVWDIHKRIIHPAIDGHSLPLIGSLPPLQAEIYEWMRSKVERWNVSVYKLYEVLFQEDSPKQTSVELDFIAAKNGLTAKGRLFLGEQMQGKKLIDDRGSGRVLVNKKDVDKYATHLASMDEMSPFSEYKQLSKEDEVVNLPMLNDQYRIAEAAKRFEESMRKRAKDDFNVKVSALRAHIAEHRTDFTQLDDGYEMLMSLSAWAATKAAELFPDREQPTEIQLRRELEDAYKKIQSLQKALDSRKSYRPNLPEVMAYSSTEIAKAG